MNATKTRAAKRARASELGNQLKDLKWLGVIVTWSSGPDGTTHKHEDVTKALLAANLDPKTARDLLPRNAFARAAKKLSEERVIDVFSQDAESLVFQFTRKHLNSKQWEFSKEAFVTLNKDTGVITSDDTDLASVAQAELDRCMEERTTADVTRIVQQLFEQHAELIPMRDAGGVYFVPQEHADFANRVAMFLETLNGRLDRIPVPEGTASGDKAIQNAVSATMEKLIEDHMTSVKGFEINTRRDTIERAADRIKHTRVKIEAYAHYLGERQKELLQKVSEANDLLHQQVEAIGGGAKAYTEYDWKSILDGKVHKLVQGEDFLGKAVSVLARARVHAARAGLKIRTSVRDDGATVILQAVKADE